VKGEAAALSVRAQRGQSHYFSTTPRTRPERQKNPVAVSFTVDTRRILSSHPWLFSFLQCNYENFVPIFRLCNTLYSPSSPHALSFDYSNELWSKNSLRSFLQSLVTHSPLGPRILICIILFTDANNAQGLHKGATFFLPLCSSTICYDFVMPAWSNAASLFWQHQSWICRRVLIAWMYSKCKGRESKTTRDILMLVTLLYKTVYPVR
jgi:hypothetical protein